MAGYDPARRSEFAPPSWVRRRALLGLVFVALSINLRAIVGTGALVNRAIETVIDLASVLVSATLALIPG